MALYLTTNDLNCGECAEDAAVKALAGVRSVLVGEGEDDAGIVTLHYFCGHSVIIYPAHG